MTTQPNVHSISQVAPPGLTVEGLAGQPTNAETRKTALEIEKLEEEIGDIRAARRWGRRSVGSVKLSEWITATAAVVLVLSAWFSGVFSATRERLETDKNRLAVEKIEIERQKEKLTGEVSALEKRLAEARMNLLPFEREGAALEEFTNLRNDGLWLTVDGTMYPEVSISVTHNNSSYAPPPRPTVRKPAIGRALDAALGMRKLTQFQSKDLTLNGEEVGRVLSHPGLISATFRNADVDRHTFRNLRANDKLYTLNLSENQVSTLIDFPEMTSVISLTLNGNPVGDDGLARLAEAFPRLERLRLRNTKVTDDACKYVGKLETLREIDLRDTNVTAKGIMSLGGCNHLYIVWASDAQFTKEVDDFFSSKKKFVQHFGPNGKGKLPHLTTDDD